KSLNSNHTLKFDAQFLNSMTLNDKLQITNYQIHKSTNTQFFWGFGELGNWGFGKNTNTQKPINNQQPTTNNNR
ncbi:MAG: hypothetical protein K9M56_10090, partial [Victivallales bacterium]|nr:hypothetical protein [Victivallales bacterium]